MAQKFWLCNTPVTLNQGQGQLDWYQNVEYNSMFWLSNTPVTLNQGQGQLDWYQNVEYNGIYHEYNSIYHHTKFESNWFMNIWMHTDTKGF